MFLHISPFCSGAHSPPSRVYSPPSRSHWRPCVKRPRYPSCHLHWFQQPLFGNRCAGVYLSRLLRFGLWAFFLFVFFGLVYGPSCFCFFHLGLRAFCFRHFLFRQWGVFFPSFSGFLKPSLVHHEQPHLRRRKSLLMGESKYLLSLGLII